VEIRILEDRPNPLLKRHEYHFEVAHATAATPSRDAVRGELSKLVKAPKDRVIIERMAARYGTATTRGDALVYETSDAAKSITRTHILIRNGLKEKVAATTPGTPAAEPAKAPSAPEAPKAEAPKEPAAAKAEPKSEAKAEHKADHKPDHKSEHKPEHKGDAKTEHPGEAKAEPHKGEHKGEHKAKAPKAEKDASPANDE
jgi:small subunit ribosomal protein S24e